MRRFIKTYGRWAFAEFTDVFQMEADFSENVAVAFGEVVEAATRK